MDYTVCYPTPLSEVNRTNDNLDVCVTFADGQHCTFVFATPKNLVPLMERVGKPYFEPGLPFLFVAELTDENIRACLDAISDNRAAKNIYGAQIWNLMDEWRGSHDLSAK